MLAYVKGELSEGFLINLISLITLSFKTYSLSVVLLILVVQVDLRGRWALMGM